MANKNNYLKPQDIIIILKIIAKRKLPWKIIDLAYELSLSTGEVSNALERLKSCKLIASDKKTPMKKNLEEFLLFGLKYVYPAQVGTFERGIPTAHSASALPQKIVSDMTYVWPSSEGTIKGISISPLYKNAAQAAEKDPKLYKLLSLVDILRIGRSREVDMAAREIKKELDFYEL